MDLDYICNISLILQKTIKIVIKNANLKIWTISVLPLSAVRVGKKNFHFLRARRERKMAPLQFIRPVEAKRKLGPPLVGGGTSFPC